MYHYRFREGERVKARDTIFNVPAGVLGTISRRYSPLWGLYEVHFDQLRTTHVVWEEDLEDDETQAVHNRAGKVR
jgi:hypothetical protein